ncbi:hypothetical protein DDK22_19580 [Cupriavidus necator]|uniref:Uncharacterized protein n=2 Tax=Cupriavidus necator TaxID=106590 RepID=A0A367PG43_CUPNE|nr:hypothetical protein DDK22_19580 [Cupriavidus necator]
MNAEDEKDALNKLAAMVVSNSEAITLFGGQLTALRQFIGAVMPQLTGAQCATIAGLFAKGVENVISSTNELPEEYHRSLLTQANILLAALEEKKSRRLY